MDGVLIKDMELNNILLQSKNPERQNTTEIHSSHIY